MKRTFLFFMLFIAVLLAACDGQIGDYTPASAISRDGFARNAAEIAALNGQEVRLWGFVDHGNLYGDRDAQAILGEWWSGDGPAPDSWRFNLKASADDATGQSFAVHVPNDAGRDDLLQAFVADAVAGRPTQVFVTGRIYAFDAPANTSDLTGLRLELESSGAIRLAPPEVNP